MSDHPDNRGVFIETWTIDLLDGDLAAALLFSQLLWWHQPGKDGRPKVHYERDGYRWLLRSDEDWQDCRLTLRQVRRIKAVLVAKGLVEVRRFKLGGAPTSAWRPLFDAVQEAIRPDPELPSEGQFLGSDAKTSVPSDAKTSVPLPSLPITTTKREPSDLPKPRKSPFPAEFILTEAMKEWADAEVPGVDLRKQTKIFADHFRGNGERKVDWVAAWRNWMRRSVEFSRPTNRHRPASSANSVFQVVGSDGYLIE